MSPKRTIVSLKPEDAYGRGYTAGKNAADKALRTAYKSLTEQVEFWQKKCAELRDRLDRIQSR